MKTIVILGSRNPKGQTAQAVNACVKGFKLVDTDVEKFFLPTRNIERCRQCEDSGWGLCRSEGRCVIEDDFAGIVDSISKADAVIFATPVYFGDLSESLRAFLDRVRRTCQHPKGQALVEEKYAIGVCVAGGGGGGTATCSVSLEKVLSTCGFNLLDVILVKRQNLKMKQVVLQTTCEWIASGKLS